MYFNEVKHAIMANILIYLRHIEFCKIGTMKYVKICCQRKLTKIIFFFLNLRDNLILIQMIQFDLRDALQRISLKGNNKVLSGVPDTQDLIKK